MKRRGGWWARVTFVDPVTGKRRDIQRRADTRKAAADLRDELLREYDVTEGRSFDLDNGTFEQFSAGFKSRFLIEPRYHDDRKIAGLRSFKTQLGHLEVLKTFFGKRRIRDIRYADLVEFRSKRLSEPTKYGRSRSIASVNRELALLSRMLRVALRENWIISNPFAAGEPLIRLADERQRQRILTFEEEKRLLDACDTDDQRKHLKPILIALLDTGCRFGEIKKLKWDDVDLEADELTLRAMNTKTLSERVVGITPRLKVELLKLAVVNSDPDTLVFGIRSNVKRAFASAKKIAGIDDLRLHDLRHTTATRLCTKLELPQVGRILGHTQPRTTYRYVNADAGVRGRAADILHAMQVAASGEPQASMEPVN
ncbi:MAG: site-specific integrase [Thermoanaerobaculia bacterium]